MFRETPASGAYSFAELNYLRMEAIDCFERCLTEGRALPLERFVEEQISQEPPRVELLREVAEEIHQRLLSLRENHFDVRDRALRMLRDNFNLDLSPLIPLADLEHYHLLDLDEAMLFLRNQANTFTYDEATLRKALEASIAMAAQTQRDVSMTEQLYDYIMDWVMGLNATVVRRSWADAHANVPAPDERVH